jgi:hypothetical protein
LVAAVVAEFLVAAVAVGQVDMYQHRLSCKLELFIR